MALKKAENVIRAVLNCFEQWPWHGPVDALEACPRHVCSNVLCRCSCLWPKHLNQTNPFKDIPGRKGLDSPTQWEVQATCLAENNNGLFHTLHLETNRDRPGQWEGPQSTAASNKDKGTQGPEDIRRGGHEDKRRSDCSITASDRYCCCVLGHDTKTQDANEKLWWSERWVGERQPCFCQSAPRQQMIHNASCLSPLSRALYHFKMFVELVTH